MARERILFRDFISLCVVGLAVWFLATDEIRFVIAASPLAVMSIGMWGGRDV